MIIQIVQETYHTIACHVLIITLEEKNEHRNHSVNATARMVEEVEAELAVVIRSQATTSPDHVQVIHRRIWLTIDAHHFSAG